MVCSLIGLALALSGRSTVSTSVDIDASAKSVPVNPGMFGVFLEEINNACQGGLYGELIQNRGFTDADAPPACKIVDGQIVPPRTDHWWEKKPVDYTLPWTVTSAYPGWTVTADEQDKVSAKVGIKPLNDVKSEALHVTFAPSQAGSHFKLVNEGYWGIGVKKGEDYLLRMYGEATGGAQLTAELVDGQGKVLTSSPVSALSSDGYSLREATLHAPVDCEKAKFVLEGTGPIDAWLSYVSLFPSRTFMDRPNGLRADLAQMIADLKPGFIRFPGGCYVEGLTIESRAQWKDTIGPLEARRPTYSPWGYWNTNGFGFHEWLQFCEDIHAKPLYVFNDGISCAFRSGTYLPDDQVPALIQDTLDALEYANGPVTSTYGAMRAKAGHPEPFNLEYVEIGNEESGSAYGDRFAQFAKVVKAKYPNVKLILSSWISGIDHRAISTALNQGPLDIVDEHAYTPSGWALTHFGHFKQYPRNVPWQLYIGEFACNGGVGTGDFQATLNDAAYMLDMQSSADLVKMGSYAPLLQREESHQWDVNLIHFNSGQVYGRASYYACKMVADNMPSRELTTDYQVNFTDHPSIAGQVGLGAFNTAVKYKDLAVTTSDGVDKKIDLEKSMHKVNGAWAAANGQLEMAKESDEGEMWTMFDAPGQVKTIKVKAFKTSGPEGFLIGLGNLGADRVQLNLGGWGNTINSVQVASGSALMSHRGQVEAGKWHDITVELSGLHIKATLDGTVVVDGELPRQDTAIVTSGIDDKTNELVVSVINATQSPNPIALNLKGLNPAGSTATVTTLKADDVHDENTFADPNKIVPVTSTLTLAASPVFVAPPRSFSILRIKLQ